MSTAHEHKRLSGLEQYQRAVEVLRGGGIVALPTDTVYGLCAVATNAAAVERVYEVKSRDAAQPLPLFVASFEEAVLIAEFAIAESYGERACCVYARVADPFRGANAAWQARSATDRR